ncbi:MAG: stage 0 sporulation family protein [Lachnospiraceae bacterium]|nr:stage 0 sporulation family protein [Lachnospiraceae bacterium]
MKTVVGVRFRNAGKVYFFEPGSFDVKRGSKVIVETARGIELGTCVNDPSEIPDEEVVAPLKPIMRIASETDIKQAADNHAKEKEAYKLCQQKIHEHNLEMKLIDAEYTFDNSKILFYFTADGRVDFRELVKDLAGVFRTRIELRQVGVRDETKILGGMGICGRPLCCHSYLSDFVPVSIKMAKEQNLSLNPTKISGVCGRLMCCLNNEEEVYEEQNRKLPSAGDYVTTALGERGIVQSVNIFRETIRVLVQNGDEKEMKEYHADEIRFKKRRKKGKLELSAEELEQLKALEPEDVAELTAELAGPDQVKSDYEESVFEEVDRPAGKDRNRNQSQGGDRNNGGRNNNRNNDRSGGERNNNERGNGGNAGGADQNNAGGADRNNGGNGGDDRGNGGGRHRNNRNRNRRGGRNNSGNNNGNNNSNNSNNNNNNKRGGDNA